MYEKELIQKKDKYNQLTNSQANFTHSQIKSIISQSLNSELIGPANNNPMMNISISDDANMDDVGMENAGVPGVASSTFENDDSPELRQEILKNINRL